MKYMLLIYGAENCWTEDERTACMPESMKICDELDAQGKWIADHFGVNWMVNVVTEPS